MLSPAGPVRTKYIPDPNTPAMPVPELHPPTRSEGKDLRNPRITASPSAAMLPHKIDPSKEV